MAGSSAASSTPFETDFSLLYTVYSLPNMFLPFFGGFFVDRLGAPLCMVVFASLILAGQTLFAFGTSLQSWPVMLLGRVLFGLGGENLTVAQSALLAQWFKGKELAFAFGLNLSISRLGSVINNYVSPAIAKSSVPFALWAGMLVCAGSLVCAVLIWPIDRSAVARIEASGRASEDLTQGLLEGGERGGDRGGDRGANNSRNSNSLTPNKRNKRIVSTERLSAAAFKMSDVSASEPANDDSEEISLSDVKHFGAMFWLLTLSCLVVYGCVLPFNNVAAGILSERNYFKTPDSDCVLTVPDECSDGSLVTTPNPVLTCDTTSKHYAPVLPDALNYTDKEQLQSIGADKSSYVFASVAESDVDCNDKFWKNGCTKNYCHKSDEAATQAAHIMSIPYFMSAALSPFLGFLVDRVGNRAIIASVAPMMLLAVHATLGFTDGSPVLPLIGQGMAYSLFAAVLWPSVPLTVEEKSVGTAYGLITAIQNAGLAAFPVVISTLYNGSGDKYIPNTEVFFMCCAILGLFVGAMLNYMDSRRGGLLNSRNVEEKRKQNALETVQGPPTPLMQS
jgi:MFS family permease